MTESPTWQEVALRLALTVLAGALIGFNRSEQGRPAGLRTTILVALAAAIAMIQVNLLLGIRGKAPDSFIVMDLMRLPLGILSGMGFIGGGAILHRGNLVIGVTTAATLWFVTVIGLCFGGGQIWLGLTALGLVVLWGLRVLERRLRQDHRIRLALTVARDGPSDHEICAIVERGRLKVASVGIDCAVGDGTRSVRLDVRWRVREIDVAPPPVLGELQSLPGITRVAWNV